MLTEKIYDAAASYGAEESEDLKALCAAAELDLTSRLREGISPEECGDAFITAAAFLALAMQSEIKSASGDVESYTAGSVSVKKSSGSAAAEAAKSLRKQAEVMLARFSDGDGFRFMGVRG